MNSDLIPFIKWAFRKIFNRILKNISGINEVFREVLVEVPLLAITWWMIAVGLIDAAAVVATIVSSMKVVETLDDVLTVAKYPTYLCIAFLAYTIIAVLYEQYQDEQEQFMNKLKGK